MKTAIFIKSFTNDYGWLAYCLKSIQRFVTGQSEVVVALPENSPLPLTSERIVTVNEWGRAGYYHQMFVKMCADIHCPDSDCVLFVDSDCVFKRPFKVSEMFKNGKPMILRRSWEDAEEGAIWREPAEKALGLPATHCTMATHPSIYRNSTIKAAREHIESVHKMPLEEYVLSQERFIEFVTLGNYALAKEPELYTPIDFGHPCRGPLDKYPRPLHQFHSWGGLTPEIREQIANMLA